MSNDAQKLSGRRILVVDDNRDSADSMALMLKFMGNDVRKAYDGPSAIEAAKALAPEVVLLDIGLPGMSGYEVARELRRELQLTDAILIAQTGWGREEDIRQAHEAGFDHHLVKPVDAAALERLLSGPDGSKSRPSAT